MLRPPADGKTKKDMIQREPIAICHEHAVGARIRKALGRGAVGRLARAKPDIEIAAEDTWRVAWQFPEQRLHLTAAHAIAGQSAFPPARAVLEVDVYHKQRLSR